MGAFIVLAASRTAPALAAAATAAVAFRKLLREVLLIPVSPWGAGPAEGVRPTAGGYRSVFSAG